MTKDEIIRAVKAERRATLALLGSLDVARFDTPTALPRWRVRDVVGHLISTDKASVTGSILVPLAHGLDGLAAWNDRAAAKWADRPVPELLLGLDRWGRRFTGLARAIPGPVYRMRLPTPWGHREAGAAIWVRAYDEWIHRQDIRRALGLPDDEVDLAAVVEFLLTAIGTMTLPRMRGASGWVTVALTGVPLPEWTYDLATGEAGPGATGAARVEAPASAFVMAAAGRDRFEDLRAAGTLTIEDDAGPALALLEELLIV